ncbi:M3 family metallopeptidase [Shigella flexneri]
MNEALVQAVMEYAARRVKRQPWEWAVYAEQVRRGKFDLDEAQLKPYFELNTVLNEGVFWTANQLFRIEFVAFFDILSTILTLVCGKFLIIIAWDWRYFYGDFSP